MLKHITDTYTHVCIFHRAWKWNLKNRDTTMEVIHSTHRYTYSYVYECVCVCIWCTYFLYLKNVLKEKGRYSSVSLWSSVIWSAWKIKHKWSVIKRSLKDVQGESMPKTYVFSCDKLILSQTNRLLKPRLQ